MRRGSKLPMIKFMLLEMVNAPIHTNFFENRATDYAKLIFCPLRLDAFCALFTDNNKSCPLKTNVPPLNALIKFSNLIDKFSFVSLNSPLKPNVGVGCSIGTAPFYMIDAFSGRNSFDFTKVSEFVDKYRHFSIREVKEIPVVTIDSLFNSLYVPDLLCIDIEGYDYPVLLSMEARPKVICVENEGQIQDFDDLLDALAYVDQMSTAVYIEELDYEQQYQPLDAVTGL